jgi:hypothetical protein
MGSELTSQVENQAERAKEGIGNLQSQVVEPTTLDPTNYLENPSSISKTDYQNLKRTGGYEGPSNLSDVKNFDNVAKQTDRANQQVNAIGTEAGVDALLEKQYRRPNYSRGELSLDNTLVRNNEDNVNKINDLQERYSGINSLFNQTANQVGESINRSVRQAQENKAKFAPAENQAMSRFKQGLDQRAEDYASQDLYNKAREDLTDDMVQQALLEQLGLESGSTIYDLDLRDYLNSTGVAPTGTGIATEEDVQRYQQLANLIDDNSGYLTEAGTYKPYSINQDNVRNAIDQRRQDYERYADLSNDRDVTGAVNEMVALGNYLGGNHGAVLANAFRDVKTIDDLQSVLNQIQNGELKSGGLVYDDSYFTGFRGSDSDAGRKRGKRVRSAFQNMNDYLSRLSEFQRDRKIGIEE